MKRMRCDYARGELDIANEGLGSGWKPTVQSEPQKMPFFFGARQWPSIWGMTWMKNGIIFRSPVRTGAAWKMRRTFVFRLLWPRLPMRRCATNLVQLDSAVMHLGESWWLQVLITTLAISYVESLVRLDKITRTYLNIFKYQTMPIFAWPIRCTACVWMGASTGLGVASSEEPRCPEQLDIFAAGLTRIVAPKRNMLRERESFGHFGSFWCIHEVDMYQNDWFIYSTWFESIWGSFENHEHMNLQESWIKSLDWCWGCFRERAGRPRSGAAATWHKKKVTF